MKLFAKLAAACVLAFGVMAVTVPMANAVEMEYTTVQTEPNSGVWVSAVKVDGEVYVNGTNGLTTGIVRNERKAAAWAADTLGVQVTSVVRKGGGLNAGPDGLFGTADDTESGPGW